MIGHDLRGSRSCVFESDEPPTFSSRGVQTDVARVVDEVKPLVIDLRTRSIVTVSMLVALGRMHELKAHVRGALNNGVTREELQEIFLHASVYCGFPAAVDAARRGRKILNSVNSPGFVSTSMDPPCCLATMS